MQIRYTSTDCQIRMYIDNVDANLYPKSYGTWNGKCEDNLYCGIRAGIESDKINKGQNEGGIKRLVKFVKKTKEMFGSVELVREIEFLNDVELPKEILEVTK